MVSWMVGAFHIMISNPRSLRFKHIKEPTNPLSIHLMYRDPNDDDKAKILTALPKWHFESFEQRHSLNSYTK